jgi:DNA invertase Pin-like site-specific DNA recombinase
MKEKLYCYLRVSTKSQEEEGNSIENQRFTGKKVSKKLGMKYVEMNEGGLSSMSSNRIKFNELKEGISIGRVKNIWYYSRSRWSRNTVEDLLMKQNYFIPYKVNVFEGENGSKRDFTDPKDELLDTILTTVQQFDRQQRRQVSVSGKRHLSLTQGENGVFMGGTINFGYSNIDKRWKINPEESKWVKEIFKQYEQGKSLKNIKSLLDTNGVKPRRGKLWNLGTLNTILRNRVYIGEYFWVDKETKDRFYIVVPPIISHSLFNRVQRKIKKNTINKGNNSRKYESLLSNLLECYCGENISGQVRKSVGKNYYTCSSKRNHWKGKDVKICDNRRGMNLEITNEFVISNLQTVMNDSSILKERFKKDILSKKNINKKEIESSKKELEKKIKQVDKQIDLTVKSISINEVNHMTKKTDEKLYIQIKKNLDSEMENLESTKSRHIGEIDQLDNQKDWVDWVSKFGNKIKGDFQKVSTELLEGIIENIVVYPINGKDRDNNPKQIGHKLVINFKLPIVRDSIRYKDSKNKSKGYTLINGKNELTLNTEIPVGGRGKKKQ